jgi:hypothetical protein
MTDVNRDKQAKVPPLWAQLNLHSDLHCVPWLRIKAPLCCWKTHLKETTISSQKICTRHPLFNWELSTPTTSVYFSHHPLPHSLIQRVGPKRSDLAKRVFIAGWERERAKTERERERGRGQVLKYPSVGLSMIWLVRILWFMLIGGWGRRRIQARLEAGLWPWEAGPWPWKTGA